MIINCDEHVLNDNNLGTWRSSAPIEKLAADALIDTWKGNNREECITGNTALGTPLGVLYLLGLFCLLYLCEWHLSFLRMFPANFTSSCPLSKCRRPNFNLRYVELPN